MASWLPNWERQENLICQVTCVGPKFRGGKTLEKDLNTQKFYHSKSRWYYNGWVRKFGWWALTWGKYSKRRRKTGWLDWPKSE